MRDIDRVHLEAMIHPVRLGAKPASSDTVSVADLAEVLAIIRERGLLASTKRYERTDNFEVHFYSKPHLKHVIENAPAFEDPVVEAWYWGKLYGYSEEAIASYAHELRSVASGTRGEGVSVIVKDHELPVVGALIRSSARLLTRLRHSLHLLSRIFRGASRIPPGRDSDFMGRRHG
jgi:hypothetical protein